MSYADLPLLEHLGPEAEPVDTAEHGLRDRSEAWIRNHPDAMALFEKFALQAANAGRRFGIGLLAERIRWEYHIERRDDMFKINNSYRAYIARELVRRHPRLSAFIETRQTRDEAA
jgi:hypothetical protein